MERFKVYEPEQQIFTIFDPIQVFGKQSFEYFLVQTIQNIDLTTFWTKKDQGGESPYDPRSILSVILYGFCRGIFSSRKLENACKHDQAFMFISGFNKPDHVAICRFLQRFQKEMQDVFRQLVYLAHEKGFIDYDTLALDGTKIRANVSKAFTGTIEDFGKRVEKIDSNITKAMERLKTANDTETIEINLKIEVDLKEKEKISQFLTSAKAMYAINGIEKKQNITDPESRLMLFGDGTIREGYNAQACVDEKAGLIIGQFVSQSENDRKLLNPVLDSAIGLKENRPEIVQVLADAGYWEPEQLALAEENNFETYVPDPNQSNPFFKPKYAIPTAKIVDVKTENSEIIAVCSGGKNIRASEKIRKHKNQNQGNDYRTFYTKNDGLCLTCRYKGMCFNEKRNKKMFSMSVSKSTNWNTTQQVAERLYSDVGKTVFSQRMPLIERVFAEIKATLGFRRFFRRGLAAVATEWSFLCCSFNLRRMFSFSKEKNTA